MQELPDAIHQEIVDFCKEADTLAGQGRFDAAISIYKRAYDLLPTPASSWLACTWILTAVADAYFLKGDFAAAEVPLREVMLCPDAVDNPFIHLRRGQVFLEIGDGRA